MGAAMSAALDAGFGDLPKLAPGQHRAVPFALVGQPAARPADAPADDVERRVEALLLEDRQGAAVEILEAIVEGEHDRLWRQRRRACVHRSDHRGDGDRRVAKLSNERHMLGEVARADRPGEEARGRGVRDAVIHQVRNHHPHSRAASRRGSAAAWPVASASASSVPSGRRRAADRLRDRVSAGPAAREVGERAGEHAPSSSLVSSARIGGALVSILIGHRTEGEPDSLGEPPRDVERQRRLIDEDLHQVRGQADSVAVGLSTQTGVVTPMAVVDDRGRLVDQPVAVLENLEEDRELLPAHRLRAGPQAGIEAPEVAERGRPKGQVRARAEDAGRVGIDRAVDAVQVQVEDAALEALAESPILLDERLRRRLDLHRQDAAGHPGRHPASARSPRQARRARGGRR